MSIFCSMKTAVSGMNAQANRLSTVADNIANFNTTGYKAVSTSFSTWCRKYRPGRRRPGGRRSENRRNCNCRPRRAEPATRSS
ncbi:flagellar basal body protein, partial [Rhizobium leguminosarum]|uniref:flagellar basal body protein n=1 Tax=Rhizobium leguminosarum TaxID=384 RepID=UPI003F9E4886